MYIVPSSSSLLARDAAFAAALLVSGQIRHVSLQIVQSITQFVDSIDDSLAHLLKPRIHPVQQFLNCFRGLVLVIGADVVVVACTDRVVVEILNGVLNEMGRRGIRSRIQRLRHLG